MDRKQYLKEYNEKNKEHLKEVKRKWHEAHREEMLKKMSEYGKEWYKKNKEKKLLKGREWDIAPENRKKRVKYVQKYVTNNKEKVRSYNKQFDKGFNGKYRMVLSRHKSRWDCQCISLEDFIQIVQKPCTYCGDENKTKGIDRVDNKEGYTLKNSKSCCKQCNYMKNNWTVDEFLSRINKICQHQNSK